jgi:glutamate-1-semialdehyde 2,1-aminomutase
MQGFAEISKENEIDFNYNVVGSMFGFFFNSKLPKNFDEVNESDTARYVKFHNKMLKNGFYFAPSAYETGFICTPMNEEDIQNTINTYKQIAKEI